MLIFLALSSDVMEFKEKWIGLKCWFSASRDRHLQQILIRRLILLSLSYSISIKTVIEGKHFSISMFLLLSVATTPSMLCRIQPPSPKWLQQSLSLSHNTTCQLVAALHQAVWSVSYLPTFSSSLNSALGYLTVASTYSFPESHDLFWTLHLSVSDR